jgi:hypothetical protein
MPPTKSSCAAITATASQERCRAAVRSVMPASVVRRSAGVMRYSPHDTRSGTALAPHRTLSVSRVSLPTGARVAARRVPDVTVAGGEALGVGVPATSWVSEPAVADVPAVCRQGRPRRVLGSLTATNKLGHSNLHDLQHCRDRRSEFRARLSPFRCFPGSWRAGWSARPRADAPPRDRSRQPPRLLRRRQRPRFRTGPA